MSKVSKKLLWLLFLFFIIFSLIACDEGYGLYKREDKEVICIELVYYDNPDARSNPQKKYPLDLDKLEVLQTLDSDNFKGFLNKLEDIWVHGAAGHKPSFFSHDGLGVALTYEDDSFTLITLTNINGNYHFFTGKYDKAGNLIHSRGVPGFLSGLVRGFKSLINEYFNYQRNIVN
jgi:hypothetical protein